MLGGLQHLVSHSCALMRRVGCLVRVVLVIGYAPCAVLTGPDFQSVFNLQLWASNAKLISYYMLYGCVGICCPVHDIDSLCSGTSWGAIPFQ